MEVVKSRVWETKQCEGPGPGTCVMGWGSGALRPERRAGIADVCGNVELAFGFGLRQKSVEGQNGFGDDFAYSGGSGQERARGQARVSGAGRGRKANGGESE